MEIRIQKYNKYMKINLSIGNKVNNKEHEREFRAENLNLFYNWSTSHMIYRKRDFQLFFGVLASLVKKSQFLEKEIN